MYSNPVYNGSFADPFVLKYCGEYYAYTTGFWIDGRCFGILHSRDLVHWTERPAAMDPLPGGATCYWAPEVTYYNGRFYMYYSVGNEERMEIRVAVADRPTGPFIDSGRRLTHEEFAIDAHLFEDDDGARYLFYATDFLDHEFIGTGTVCDRMIDPFTLAGNPQPVTRARFDWQVYDPERASKGGVRWHTVEGPFVLKRKDLYFEMFSGGNWQNITYGVSFATSDRVPGDGEWMQASDGVQVLPILRTIPGKVIGPGHNSAVRGPNNREWFCVYHRWTPEGSARVLCIDRIDWAGDRMLILGPSTTPQPMPARPTIAGFLEGAATPGDGWSCSAGSWIFREDVAMQESVDIFAEARCTLPGSSFLMEVSLRALENPMGNGRLGICFAGEDGAMVRLLLGERNAVVTLRGRRESVEEPIALPEGFDLSAYHLLRVDLNGRKISFMIDGPSLRWEQHLDFDARELLLITEGMAASFDGFELGLGWEDLFMEDGDPTRDGWEVRNGTSWYIRDRELRSDGGDELALIAKGAMDHEYELVVNARLMEPIVGGRAYGFYPAFGRAQPGPIVTTELDAGRWKLVCSDSSGIFSYPLPDGFDPLVHQQFRFRKERGRLLIGLETGLLGEVPAPLEPTRVGLSSHRAPVAFDMVRLTVIGSPLQSSR